jgi:hypothetical protein
MKTKKNTANSKKWLKNIAFFLAEIAAGRITQPDIAEKAGLSRSSVSNAIRYMLKEKLIEKSGSIFTKGGKKPIVQWKLSPDICFFLSTYFGRRHNYFAVYDFTGQRINMTQTPASQDIGGAISELAMMIKKNPYKPLYGISMAISGIIDRSSGIICRSKMWNVENYPAVERLEKKFLKMNHVPLIVCENNSRLIALGLTYSEMRVNSDNFITLNFEEGNPERLCPMGIGSAMFLDGRIHNGFRGAAGELDSFFWECIDVIKQKQIFISLSNLDRADIDFLAKKLAEKFAHLVNYLAVNKIFIVFDKKNNVVPEFANVFSKKLNSGLLMSTDSVDVETADNGLNAVLDGGAVLLKQKFFSDNKKWILEFLRNHPFPQKNL